MGENATRLAYLVTIVTFVIALRFLSDPARARRGNQIGAVGMLIAIVVTLAQPGVVTYWEIAPIWFPRRARAGSERNRNAMTKVTIVTR